MSFRHRWRPPDRELHGCRFVVAVGRFAELVTLLWALQHSGHLADCLKGCGEEGLAWPESMGNRARYAQGAWFMPIAGCMIGGGEDGWARRLDAAGPTLALEV